ncbi:hypothetical protein TSUD_240260 [Trifolium subterraneum]|uniref:UDP-glycosyltransferases domain-containing protein n=1 Tax=Trifolium subterraneum TaxID=3900 RepID=A0A2Z6P5Z8_TRISU|nr:hypothetical protein TSUD_240260 [Trifolium subterraneum]
MSRCAELLFEQHTAHTEFESDYDKFTIVGFPNKLEMTRSHLPYWMRKSTMFGRIMKVIRDVNGAGNVRRKHPRSPPRNVRGGNFASIPVPTEEFLSPSPSPRHDFIWVIHKNNDKEDEDEGFMEEFEKRVKESNKGYLIWSWAPQLLILENKAIGAIVTHCGRSTPTESINIGLPMVTWPLSADQFFNEKILVDVLKIMVSLGAKEWRNWDAFGSKVVKREEIEKAIGLVMGNGKEAEKMRLRAKGLSDDAKKAILAGGSSHANLMQLIEQLKSLKLQRLNSN